MKYSVKKGNNSLKNSGSETKVEFLSELNKSTDSHSVFQVLLIYRFWLQLRYLQTFLSTVFLCLLNALVHKTTPFPPQKIWGKF